jgi:hypothetical protein
MNQTTPASATRHAITWFAHLPRKAKSEAQLVRDALLAVAEGAVSAYSEFLRPAHSPREN